MVLRMTCKLWKKYSIEHKKKREQSNSKHDSVGDDNSKDYSKSPSIIDITPNVVSGKITPVGLLEPPCQELMQKKTISQESVTCKPKEN